MLEMLGLFVLGYVLGIAATLIALGVWRNT
jgi:hypothetical protein